MGPVQVLVVGFERPAFSGEVVAELTRLEEAGIVRLVDVLVVSRTDDGDLEVLDPPVGEDAGLRHRGQLAAELLFQPDGGADPTEPPAASADAPDALTWSLAHAVPAGSAAAVALIEHVWASPLRAAIHRAGGTPLEETWLAPGDVETLEGLIAERQS
jgi:Family of unknown function (DUF6325)